MKNAAFSGVVTKLTDIRTARAIGRVSASDGNTIEVEGLSRDAKLGDRVSVYRRDHCAIAGEVLRLDENVITMLPDEPAHQIALGDRVLLQGPVTISPSEAWLGRIIDPYGNPMDGDDLPSGPIALSTRNDPPSPTARKPWGMRLNTGFDVMNTFFPLVQGQRIGVFSEPGVGKSTLLRDLVSAIEADVIVLALVGERGREVNELKHRGLAQDVVKRTIIVAATAHTAPTTRVACAQTAVRISEFFRDQGRHVALFVDSISRFADAHREAAIASGELPILQGFPASTFSAVTRIAERTGSGSVGQGDITAIFSALLKGSGPEDAICNALRGVMDGHVLLDRALAERGVFPAIDIKMSLSRSLTVAASQNESSLVSEARRYLSKFDEVSAILHSGLYVPGSDNETDHAIRFNSEFSSFRSRRESESAEASFATLALALKRSNMSSP